jgi:hypothetical protein
MERKSCKTRKSYFLNIFRDGEREARLDGIRAQMMGVDPETRIHFEMASFVDETLLGNK